MCISILKSLAKFPARKRPVVNMLVKSLAYNLYLYSTRMPTVFIRF